MFKEATTLVRDYIVEHSDEWQEVIKSLNNEFIVAGSALKNVPKGYDKEHPCAQYLQYKSWYIEYPIDDALLKDPQAFLDLAIEKFKQMKRLNDFLNQALIDFQMPERK